MSGLLALFNTNGIGSSMLGMTARFPSHAAHRDGWRDRHFEAVRLHHGVVSPRPQPVWSDDGAVCLFLDGELFPTDTAVPCADAAEPARTCLELYRSDRFDGFAELNGSFALVVYDRVRRTITLVSDRHGTRPVYYFIAGTELAAASHIAALTGHPACPRRLDRQSLHELLTFRAVLGDRTIYRGIEAVPPGSAVTFDGRLEQVRSYWQLSWRPPSIAKKDAAAALADGIRRAVRRGLSGGGRPGLLLSGGLDSRVVLAAADQPLVCFTIGIGETEQVASAHQAAALAQASCRYLKSGADSYWSTFEEAVRLTSGIYGAQHNHFLPVLEEIRTQCDVLLHGWAIGSIYRDHALPARKLKLGRRAIDLPWLTSVRGRDLAASIAATREEGVGRDAVDRILSPEARAEHRGRLEQAIADTLRGYHPEPGTSPYRAWDYVAFRAIGSAFSYPNILSIRSRMDERTPALDRELMELFLAIPPEWRVPDSIFRAALGHLSPPLAGLAYADTGLPASVDPRLAVPLRLGRHMLEMLHLRPRAGPDTLGGRSSWPNFGAMLRQHPAFRERLEGLARSEALLACGMFDMRGLKTVVGGHLLGNMNEPKLLLMLLTLDSWIRQFGADGIG